MPRIAFIQAVLLCFVVCSGRAQLPQVENIGVEQGLSQGFISALWQDRDDFMWFGTNNGLNRYDGHEFLIFKNDPYDPFSISSDKVQALAEAGDFLCVITRQLDLYDRQTRRFYRLPQTLPLFQEDHGKLVVQNDTTIWALSFMESTYRLYRISWPRELASQLYAGKSIESLVRIEAVLPTLAMNEIGLSPDRRTLWIAGDRKLYAYDPATGTLSLKSELPPPTSDRYFMEVDAQGGIWMNRLKEVIHFDGVRCHLYPLPPLASLWYMDQRRNLVWIQFNGKLCAFDPQHLPSALTVENAVQTLPPGALSGFADVYGIVWGGNANAKGIRKFNPRTGAFKNYLPGVSIYGPFLTDEKGDILYAFQEVGQYNIVLDRTTGLARAHTLPRIPELEGIFRAVRDEQGDYWIVGRLFPTLLHYRPGTGTIERFALPDDCSNAPVLLRYVAPGQLWIVQARQLIHFDINTRKLAVYPFSHLNDQCLMPSALEYTADGNWWIGFETGLIKATPTGAGNNFQFSLWQNDPQDRNSLAANYIKSLLADPADPNILWIGTSGRGLDRLDIRNHTFRHYTTQQGLPDDVIYGMVAEDLIPNDGDLQSSVGLWLSTNKGLSRFNPQTGSFRNFFKSDGLQDNEFNTLAFGKTRGGQLVFGGVNGMTIFDPAAIHTNSRPPRVFITSLKINNKVADMRDSAAVLQRAIEHTQAIELNYTQNNLTLQFVALDLTQPARNRFRFYLEGAEAPWSHEGFEHTAQYLNLAPGAYVFHVKGANSDGVWNETPTTLRITIRPPWWASWWAYGWYFLLAAGAVYGIFRFQLKRRWEQAETERLKELDTVKTRLYTNITHGFRTPLTVILGMAEQVQDYLTHRSGEAPTRAVALIRRNGQALLQLINQMLDLAKLESGHLRLENERGDVVSYLRYLTESFQSFAAGKQIQLHFLSDLPALEMNLDRNKLQTIVGNLLSNAIKYTPENGHIYLQISQEVRNGRPNLLCRVRDTGIGVTPEQLPHLFDRFFQADNSTTRQGEGTGIGLALVHELVKLMGGDIRVESEPGRGTVFSVMLPIDSTPPAGMDAPEQEKTALPPVYFYEDREDPVALASLPSDDSGNSGLPSLLLVEDNADVAEYIRACVSPGFAVEIAVNGALGIDHALEAVPDIIISDVMMPLKDGYELCDTLKQDERTSHIPIVLLTAKATTDDRIAGLRRGADAYLVKPFHREELLVLLDGLLENRRRVQAQYRRVLLHESVVSSAVTPQERVVEDAFLQKIRVFVEQELGNPQLSVDSICRAAGMGRSNLQQKFTALAGMPLMQYVRDLRLQKSKELLAGGQMNVSEVAFEVGFDDPKYFSRLFSEAFGMPPTQWSKQ